MRNEKNSTDQFVIECSNGEIVLDEDDLVRCDYFRHLVNGQKKLNQLNKESPRKSKYTITSGKLYPLKILEFYFELLLHYRIQEIKDSKSILDQKPTYFILQVLGFLFSDGRGEIYNSQKDLIGHLCEELRKRALHETKRSLVNQILTLASFSFESNQIEETIMKIRQFLDVETFNEVLLDFSDETDEFKTQEIGINKIIRNDLTFGIRIRHAIHLTDEEKQIDMIKLIGQVYSYFRFLYWFDDYIFTTCGAVGPNGPSYGQCVKAYEDLHWAKDERYFKMGRDGYQTITIPETGSYSVELRGAGYSNGFGACLRDTFNFKLGDQLTFVIGQVGSAGGNGGSFLSINDDVIAVAGGGGRDANYASGKKIGRPTGKGCFIRGGGGGIKKNGEIGVKRVAEAGSFSNGCQGGTAENSDRHFGGFGGGGYCGGGGGYHGGDANFATSTNGSSFSSGSDHCEIIYDNIGDGSFRLIKL